MTQSISAFVNSTPSRLRSRISIMRMVLLLFDCGYSGASRPGTQESAILPALAAREFPCPQGSAISPPPTSTALYWLRSHASAPTAVMSRGCGSRRRNSATITGAKSGYRPQRAARPSSSRAAARKASRAGRLTARRWSSSPRETRRRSSTCCPWARRAAKPVN